MARWTRWRPGTRLRSPSPCTSVCLWFLHGLPRQERWTESVPNAITIIAVVLVPLTGWGVLLIGVVLAMLLAYKLVTRHHRRTPGAGVTAPDLADYA